MRIDDALAGVTKLGLDTPPIIYFIESHPVYDIAATEVFGRIEAGSITGVTSVISMTEVLIHPLRRSDARLYEKYRELLVSTQHLELVSIGPAIAEGAAVLRSHHGLRVPDALQLASAIESDCQAFLTNDTALRRVDDIRIIILGELEP